MSDITYALKCAIASALRADAGVAAAFGPTPIRIYDIPGENASLPYLTLGAAQVSRIPAERFDLSETAFAVHVWSLTSPPSTDEAEKIAAAVREAMKTVTVSDGGRVYAAEPDRTDYLIDPADGRTVHAVVAFLFTTAPA